MPMPTPNPKQLHLIHTLLLLSKKAKRLDELLLEGLNITINELYILYAADQESVISLKDLKADLQIQPASLSRVLGNMYDEDLIERSFSGQDKRSINIALTEKGKDILKQSKAMIKKALESDVDLGLDCVVDSVNHLNNFVMALRDLYKGSTKK